jgi:hypothetical protein
MELHIQPLEFPEAELHEWEQGTSYKALTRLPASSFVKHILEEKLCNRSNPSRRFFGEAFVAAHLNGETGWYGSFKWLTSWPTRPASRYGAEYRAALKKCFPSVSSISSIAFALCEHLDGKKPVPPDLWLIIDGQHHFIEVKLPGDAIRPTQIAGLALIAACLSSKDDVSVCVYNLYPHCDSQTGLPRLFKDSTTSSGASAGRPNDHVHLIALSAKKCWCDPLPTCAERWLTRGLQLSTVGAMVNMRR